MFFLPDVLCIVIFYLFAEYIDHQTTHMYSEQNITEGLKLGKEDAYKFLYDREYGILCVLALEYTHDKFIAETIVSDVIFSIWKNRENLEIHTSLRAYLVKAVRNKCFNFLSTQKREVSIDSQIDALENVNNHHNTGGEYPIDFLIEEELDLRIEKIIESMPELTSRIFRESRMNDLKYTDISQKLGVSVDVVKYHIKIALSTLRRNLRDYLIFLMFIIINSFILP